MGAPFEFVDAFNDRMRKLHTYDDEARDVAEALGLGMSAGDAAAALGMFSDSLREETAAFVEAWPEVLRDALIALVQSSLRTGTLVRMAWMPAHDFQVTIAKANSGGSGEITIVLGSKYPDEVAALSF